MSRKLYFCIKDICVIIGLYQRGIRYYYVKIWRRRIWEEQVQAAAREAAMVQEEREAVIIQAAVQEAALEAAQEVAAPVVMVQWEVRTEDRECRLRLWEAIGDVHRVMAADAL